MEVFQISIYKTRSDSYVTKAQWGQSFSSSLYTKQRSYIKHFIIIYQNCSIVKDSAVRLYYVTKHSGKRVTTMYNKGDFRKNLAPLCEEKMILWRRPPAQAAPKFRSACFGINMQTFTLFKCKLSVMFYLAP